MKQTLAEDQKKKQHKPARNKQDKPNREISAHHHKTKRLKPNQAVAAPRAVASLGTSALLCRAAAVALRATASPLESSSPPCRSCRTRHRPAHRAGGKGWGVAEWQYSNEWTRGALTLSCARRAVSSHTRTTIQVNRGHGASTRRLEWDGGLEGTPRFFRVRRSMYIGQTPEGVCCKVSLGCGPRM